jgi:YfiH family protein
MKFEIKKVAEWSFFQIPELEKSGIIHGFCTGDSPSDLLHEETKQHFLDAFSLNDVVVMNQEHGDQVHVVGKGEKPVSGDGLIIYERKVAGIIKTADCLPIILSDIILPLVSIIHAGWRGTVKGITRKAVGMMEKLGSRKENLTALLGPSIGPCCYEVKDDVHSLFIKNGFPEQIFHTRNNSLYLDLKLANAWVLQESDVGSVRELHMCTYCNHNLLNSFRRGDTGKRQINFVYLEG